tara:strand:- start:5276 stop:5794 length:519 start_codon:yes stop_codon:yes gene_type:complete
MDVPAEVCVVGNGPLTLEDRRRIDACPFVIRFNDRKNLLPGERTDLLALRDKGDGWHGESRCDASPVVLIENPSSARTRAPSACHTKYRLAHPHALFRTCANATTASAEWGASSGTVILDALQQDPKVSRVDVFAMNWKLEDSKHLRGEGDLLKQCASKAVIHRTNKDTYLP